jgi:hypothetical protein
VADLFLVRLNRQLTLDHHKPFAASEVFDFISTFTAPLGDISGTEIIVAIRAEQGSRITDRP